MARAHRVALIATVLTSIYLLAFFSVLPVPFLGEEVVQEILPVVSDGGLLLFTDIFHLNRFHGGSWSRLDRTHYGLLVGA
jgi:hypothetical protein